MILGTFDDDGGRIKQNLNKYKTHKTITQLLIHFDFLNQVEIKRANMGCKKMCGDLHMRCGFLGLEMNDLR